MHDPAAMRAMASLRLQSPRTSSSATAPKATAKSDPGDLLPSLHAQTRPVQPQKFHCENRHDQSGQRRAPLTTRRHGRHGDRAENEPRAAGGNDIDGEEPSLQPTLPDLTDRRLVRGFSVSVTTSGRNPKKPCLGDARRAARWEDGPQALQRKVPASSCPVLTTRLQLPESRYVGFRQWLHSSATPLGTLFTGMDSRHGGLGIVDRKLAMDARQHLLALRRCADRECVPTVRGQRFTRDTWASPGDPPARSIQQHRRARVGNIGLVGALCNRERTRSNSTD